MMDKKVIKRAAKRARLVFISEAWMYGHDDDRVYPKVKDIKNIIKRLLKTLDEYPDADSASTGRIIVQRDLEYGNYNIYLDLLDLNEKFPDEF